MEFHSWMIQKLSDVDIAAGLFDQAKQSFSIDKDVKVFASVIDDIITAQEGSLHDFMEGVYLLSGVINLYYSKNYEVSLDHYNKVLEINPNNPIALKDKETVRSHLGEFNADIALIAHLQLAEIELAHQY